MVVIASRNRMGIAMANSGELERVQYLRKPFPLLLSVFVTSKD